jgi:hypothetical protein
VQLHHVLHGRIRLLHVSLGAQSPGQQIKRTRILRVHVYRLPQQTHGSRSYRAAETAFPI